MTNIPKIETFEHDIIDEVNSKNTNIADIASYSEDKNKDSGNTNFIFIMKSESSIVMIRNF